MVGRHQVGHQSASPSLAPGGHDGRAHQGVGDECRLHLAGLDTVSAHLELGVDAAQELQSAVRTPPCTVAGAVHAGPVAGEGVGHEPLRRERGAAPVAARHLGAGDVQFAHHADRHRAQGCVEHVDAGVGQGGPERHHSVGEHSGVESAGDHADRGLGRAVVVDDGPLSGGLQQAAQPDRRGALPAQHEAPAGDQPLHAGVGGQGRQMGRHHLDPVHRPSGQVARDGTAVERDVPVEDVQDATGREAAEHDGVAEVGDGGLQQSEPLAGAPAGPVHHGDDVVHRTAVCDLHALRPAGGTRRVDDVGELARQDGDVGGLGGLCGQDGAHRGVVEDDRAQSADREFVDEVLGADHHFGAAVGEHEAEAFGRVVGVQRQIRPSGLPHGQDGHDHVGSARQAQRHDRLRADADGPQVVGQPVGAGGEGAVGQRAVAGDHRHRVRGRRGALGDQFGYAARRGDGDRSVVPLPEQPVQFVGRQHGQS